MPRITRNTLRRTSALILGGAVALAGALAFAAPAAAVPATTYILNSTVVFTDEGEIVRPETVADIQLKNLSTNAILTASASYTNYSFSGLVDGNYKLTFTSTNLDYPAEATVVNFTVAGADPVVPETVITPYPKLGGGAVTVTGSSVVGQTLTGSVAAFTGTNGATVTPDSVTYSWGYSRGYSGDEIPGATGATVVVPEAAIGSQIFHAAVAKKSGFRPTYVNGGAEGVVSTPQKAAAPAPVADSSQVDALLAQKFVEKIAPADAGLPVGGLSPETSYTAKIDWFAPDSFVDVYSYSSPRLVGTFAVVDGVVQVNLTPAILAMIGSGTHTLVYVGQTTGDIQAVAFEVRAVLASTGADLTTPLIAGGALLFVGGALLVIRRRRATKA